eukprot:TRINITY_DN12579_c0_g1_i1.p2 TRINITY_DN12579_c0_g1~~TRINITY_DN12579_c0_g1_i1.p2  ORF type:complete len:123 (+),score=0.47 TRINITY_DN12579_c0_g1_i1:214-582(+)
MESTPDTVMLGYSVLDEFRNRGYTTEAVCHLIPCVFTLPGIQRIAATTYPDLGASIRVLEKNGFAKTDLPLTGTGAEEGTICYLLERMGKQRHRSRDPEDARDKPLLLSLLPDDISKDTEGS